MSLDARFQAAVEIVQKLPKEGEITTSNDQKLHFYSLFKQATIGDVNTERPGMFSFTERAKWDAWNGVKGMRADEAKEKYVEALLKMFDGLEDNGINVAEALGGGSSLDPSIKANLAILGKGV